MDKADRIDAYFGAKNYYSWIPYKPIGSILVEECERMGVGGLWISTAAALVEQESGGKNLFGCDWGGKWTNVPPYCQVLVTRERVQALIRNINNGGGQNGVGLTQLTSLGYVMEAERMGGAHIVRYQMRVGFKVLNDNINDMGFQPGASAYNAGRGNWRAVYKTYGAELVAKQDAWQRRLN